MPTFDINELQKHFSPKAANAVYDWFHRLEKESPTVAACFRDDETSLVDMRSFLEEVIAIHGSYSAFSCIGRAIISVREKEGVEIGQRDSLCLLGSAADKRELKEAAFVHIRRRSLPDRVLRRTSQRLGETFMAEADKTVEPIDWFRYCRLHGAPRLGNWRGFVWLAPLEDVQPKIASDGHHAVESAYWYFRHWVLVGMPWHFTPYGPIDEILAGLDADRLFVVLLIHADAIDTVPIATVLNAVADSPEVYFFRPRGWWKARGQTAGTFGLTLDLFDNWDGLAPKSGAREAISCVQDNIHKVCELQPRSKCFYNLSDEVEVGSGET